MKIKMIFTWMGILSVALAFTLLTDEIFDSWKGLIIEILFIFGLVFYVRSVADHDDW